MFVSTLALSLSFCLWKRLFVSFIFCFVKGYFDLVVFNEVPTKETVKLRGEAGQINPTDFRFLL